MDESQTPTLKGSTPHFTPAERRAYVQGYNEGWQGSIQHRHEHSIAYTRSWFEWPLIVSGLLVLAFAGFVALLGRFDVVNANWLSALAVIGAALLGGGLWWQNRATRASIERVANFNRRWAAMFDLK